MNAPETEMMSTNWLAQKMTRRIIRLALETARVGVVSLREAGERSALVSRGGERGAAVLVDEWTLDMVSSRSSEVSEEVDEVSR